MRLSPSLRKTLKGVCADLKQLLQSVHDQEERQRQYDAERKKDYQESITKILTLQRES